MPTDKSRSFGTSELTNGTNAIASGMAMAIVANNTKKTCATPHQTANRSLRLRSASYSGCVNAAIFMRVKSPNSGYATGYARPCAQVIFSAALVSWVYESPVANFCQRLFQRLKSQDSVAADVFRIMLPFLGAAERPASLSVLPTPSLPLGEKVGMRVHRPTGHACLYAETAAIWRRDGTVSRDDAGPLLG